MDNEESLSQAEVDDMIAGMDMSDDPNASGLTPLSRDERDTMVEISNISMGASASTLSAILGQEVDLVTPHLTEFGNLSDFAEPYPGEGKVMVSISYTAGLSGAVAYIFKDSEAKAFTSLLLGESAGPPGEGINAMEMDALAEVLGQALQAGATSFASMISKQVDIAQPQVSAYSQDALLNILPKITSESFIQVDYQFKMQDGSTLNTVQLLSSSDTKSQVSQLLAILPDTSSSIPKPGATGSEAHPMQGQPNQPNPNDQGMPPNNPMMGFQQPMQNHPSAGGAQYMQTNPVTVQPVQFPPLDNQQSFYGEQNKNLELVMDVTLNLTVELGKTEISIKEVLELTRGSVIELDRIAGEPVDLLANGKLIAKGEVVVIEDNFGLRITSIVSPADRLRGL